MLVVRMFPSSSSWTSCHMEEPSTASQLWAMSRAFALLLFGCCCCCVVASADAAGLAAVLASADRGAGVDVLLVGGANEVAADGVDMLMLIVD